MLRRATPPSAPRRSRQLQAWGDRNHVPVIAQHGGADAASVIFDAPRRTARGLDVLIADTAGRLHTKSNLMEELAKIVRVMRRSTPTRRTRCCWWSTPRPARTRSTRPPSSTGHRL